MNENKKHSIGDYWNMGTAIGLCAAVGIALGAVLNNLIPWLCAGAAIGAVLGAVTQLLRKKAK
jgi:ABC-type Mn2+/Zn2+ transport system permease subunit